VCPKNRGLDFTAQALRRSMDNPAEELNISFTKAYESTLRKHHKMLVRPVFSVSWDILLRGFYVFTDMLW